MSNDRIAYPICTSFRGRIMTHRSNTERESPVFSASSVLDTVGEALTAIRIEDKLTFADIAAVLGVSDDQAAKYCAGAQTMNLVTFARGGREWNGRLGGSLYRLCSESRPTTDTDRGRGNKVLRAALALSISLEGHEDINPEHVRANRAVLENARDALADILGKLGPQEMRA